MELCEVTMENNQLDPHDTKFHRTSKLLKDTFPESH